MADNVSITAGAGTSIAADEVTDGTLGSVKVQFIKLMDGTLDSTNKAVVSAAGAVKVDASSVAVPVTDNSGSLTVDNAGTFAVQSATNADAAIAAGTAPSKALISGGVYNSTEPSPTTGQTMATQLDSKGRARQVIMDAAGNTRGANVNASSQLSVSVDNTVTVGSHAVTNAGTFAVQAAQSGTWTAATNADAALTAGTAPSKALVGGGQYNSTEPSPTTGQTVATQLDSKGRARQVIMDAAGNTRGANVNASSQLSVSVDNTVTVGSHAVTNAGTFAVQGACAGDVASGSSDSGNPQKIGGVGHTANPTAVTDGQRVNGIFDKLGKQICVGAIRELKGNQQTSISASTSETTIVTAVASTFLDLYGLVLANTGATTTKVSIRDDTAGTVRMIFEVPTLETRGFMLPVDSAVTQTAVNKNWTAQCASSTTALEVTALFVKNI